MRDAAETGLGVLFGVVLAATVGAFALLRHPRGREPLPAPSPPPPRPPIAPPPIAPPGQASAPAPAPAPSGGFHADIDLRPYPGAAPWLPYIEQQVPLDARGQPVIPVPFVLQWIQMESDGQVCAIGFPGEMDAQGRPLETGLFQFMSPHDIALAGTTVEAMRRCCSSQVRFPGLTRQPPTTDKSSPAYKQWAADVARARAIEQTQTSACTEADKQEQIRAGLTYITNAMQIVDSNLARHGVAWSHGLGDFWCGVKSVHAGSGIMTSGLDAAATALGRAPTTWDELVQGIHASAIGHQWDGLLSNAQRCGMHAFPRQAGV